MVVKHADKLILEQIFPEPSGVDPGNGRAPITRPCVLGALDRREADVVLRPVDSGEENLIGRKIGRLGTG